MAELRFYENSYVVDNFDTVLNTLLQNGHAVPNSCRGGHCHSCLMKAVTGAPMPFSQIGLAEELVADNYFLACQCQVYANMQVEIPAKEKRTRFTAMVHEKTQLSEDVLRIRLDPARDFAYKAGQFTSLINIYEQSGDFALASVHGRDFLMEFHVTRHAGRAIDSYIWDELDVDDALEVQTAFAAHYYRGECADKALVLIAIDADLAGAYGLLQDAVLQKHAGPIYIFHGLTTLKEPYLYDALEELSNQIPSITFNPFYITTANSKREGGQTLQTLLNEIPEIHGARFYCWDSSGRSDGLGDMLGEILHNSSIGDGQLFLITP